MGLHDYQVTIPLTEDYNTWDKHTLSLRLNRKPISINDVHSLRTIGGRAAMFGTPKYNKYVGEIQRAAMNWTKEELGLLTPATHFIITVQIGVPNLYVSTARKKGYKKRLSSQSGDTDNGLKYTIDPIFKYLRDMGYEVDDKQVVPIIASKVLSDSEYTLITIDAFNEAEKE